MPRNVNSAAQQNHRASFKLIVDAYDSFGGITDEGFPGRPRTYSPYNAFMEANLNSAIDNTGDTPVIDYSKLRVSDGSLPVLVINGSTTGAAGITITYESDLDTPKVDATDQIVAFVKLKKGSLLVARQVRGKDAISTILISYPGIAATDVVCCYAYVLNEDGTKVSKSVFVQVS